jgi:hypothetical protein
MTARGIVISEQRPALEELHAIAKELDPEAAAGLVRFIPGGVVPNPDKQAAEYNLFMTEVLLILARAVRGKKRGRKPNVQWHDEESKAS